MKLPALQQSRRSNSLRASAAPLDGGLASDAPLKQHSAFWLLVHGICCIVSLALGFRFSRLIFFLLFSTPTTITTYSSAPVLTTTTATATATATATTTETLTFSVPIAPPNRTVSRVVVGRHGILVRPWPHPNPAEVMRAHHIIGRVQREQRVQHGVRNPRPLLVVTPTYVRTFQALHLTALMHSLMLLPYELTWLVVEAGGASDDTAALLAGSRLKVLHLPFGERMPLHWADRHRMEARMRLHALRVVRERSLDGLVVFADDSNVHNMELFDEIQSVRWMGALSVGILVHPGNSDSLRRQQQRNQEDGENTPMPIQGPACNASGQLVGWHTFNPLPYGPYAGKSKANVGGGEMVLPRKLEWAGFVLNSRLVWKEAEVKPDWVRDLDTVGLDGEEIESPLSLLKDASYIEPLGSCGKKVLLWWLRVEARYDSKFPTGWIIEPPLEIIVPAKRTPWPDAPPELPPENATTTGGDHAQKRSAPKTGRSSRSRRGSRGKKKHEPHGDSRLSGQSQRHAK